jgi:phosphoglycerol transferase MdoB-like AlkP superfamily enzyme
MQTISLAAFPKSGQLPSMTDAPKPAVPWSRSRYGFAVFNALCLLLGWHVLRVVLLFAFRPAVLTASDFLQTLTTGLHRDLVVAPATILPQLLWFLIIPNSWFTARWHRVLLFSACFLFWFGQIFLFFTEYFFFEEFKSRFNTVAVDYLIYPHEVAMNIWQSYPVLWILLTCLVLSLAWLFAARRLFAGMWDRHFTAPSRALHFFAGAAAVVLLALSIDSATAHVSNDRILNELANNGDLAFLSAAWTRNLDYSAFYKTLPKPEAYQRARRILNQPGSQFVEEGESIRRRFSGDSTRPRLNVILFLEESLGSEFWGCLGRKGPSLTSEMDKLATEEGVLFTNLYASGNRTVRGFEGVLSSFPPLPGDSIVKRDRSDNVETIARVLKRDGYSTVFLYGGRGVFDGMRSFALRNGYDQFIEQKHFEHPSFTTAWGVCDEDIFARAIDEFRGLADKGKPFFGTILSVSNHKPYTYPKGRIPEDPARKHQNNAVKYSDFALGQFFRAAKKESFWTNTIFVVVADHGARVYGKQSIPIHSYEIPLVILGPAVVKAPAKVSQLGCSLDVSPTVLGLLGRPYQSLFFGQDLLKSKPEDGRVFLNHNRDIGMLAGERMVVLGLRQTDEFYEGNPKLVDVNLLAHPTDADRELEKDAISIYQIADDLYMHRLYRLKTPPEITLIKPLP